MRPVYVRAIVATFCLFGLFTGGYIGVFLNASTFEWGSEILTSLLVLGLALLFGAMILLVLRLALAPHADRVSPRLMLKTWAGTIVGLYLVHALLPEALSEAYFMRSIDIAAVWLAGAWAVEPFPFWKGGGQT